MAYAIIPPTPPTGGYRLNVTINSKVVPFLLDTGAAVTLLRENIWRELNVDKQKLEPAPNLQLVGVDGSPLQARGRTQAELNLGGEAFRADIVVVDTLTTEGILGLDFLQKHGAVVDLGGKRLVFSDRDLQLPLDGTRVEGNGICHVSACEKFTIPPYSELEVMASVETPTGTGKTWILERSKRPAAAVASAIVNPTEGTIPVRLLNVRAEPVTIHRGEEIGTLEEAEAAPTQPSVIAGVQPREVSKEKQELLWQTAVQTEGLSEAERKKFYDLLISYEDLFATSDSDMGRTKRIKHSICTGDSPPIRQAVRRVPPARREEVKQLLGNMLKNDVIQPSSSPWASPIVLVRKKDGSMRFCIDYRKVNAVTRKDAYPLPRIDTTLDTLAGSQLFSTLDLLSGYWQVEVEEEDRAKTAFCTTEGLFEFKVMPFGLCNGPATFQRLMDLVLAGLQWSQCLVYLDDIIIIGRDFEEHLSNLQSVFQRLREAGLKLKPRKCHFLRHQVEYLGHIVSRDGVATDPAKTSKVATWCPPTTTKEAQQFLGFASYYRRFIKDFAQIAKPLHRLAERNTKFLWTAECEKAFHTLREKLTSTPVLAYPDFTREFILDTDASDTGIGGVLSQIDQSGQERVIAYASRVLSKPERKYCVTRRELLAVIVFLREFRHYLLGRHFTLRTDHGSLVWLCNFREPEGQLARWLEIIQEFDFTILHRRGKLHTMQMLSPGYTARSVVGKSKSLSQLQWH